MSDRSKQDQSEQAERSLNLGFIGVGTMGFPIAKRLISAGFAVTVFDSSSTALDALSALGAKPAPSPMAVAAEANLVFLSLPGPKQVEAVVGGPQGVLEGARAGSIIVDLSTNAFDVVRQLHDRAEAKGVAFLDAPVSGGRPGAEAGTLSVMIGGEAAAVELIRPVLSSFAKNVFHVGAAGMGTIAKLVNNQIFLAAAVVVQEGFVLAAKAGLESGALAEILRKSSAAGYLGFANAFFSRNFDNPQFTLALAQKDIDLALQSAASLEVSMPTTDAARNVYLAALNQQLGGKAFYATLSALEHDAKVQVAKLPKP
jgi:3-hydroxyisobutyrate dehydrogenase-like beta-hydroxyacid dehydrogenase